MPNNMVNEYLKWLSGGDVDRAVVDTIQIYHPTVFPTSLYLANWDVPITRLVSDPYPSGVEFSQEFSESRFYYEPAAVADTTDQSTTLTVSSLDGAIYELLMGMTVEERREPIVIIPRLYFDNDDGGEALIQPAPIWTLHSVNCSLTALRGELRAAPLRTQRVGRYYTALDFPVLEMLR